MRLCNPKQKALGVIVYRLICFGAGFRPEIFAGETIAESPWRLVDPESCRSHSTVKGKEGPKGAVRH
jgi:hypothetical protein